MQFFVDCFCLPEYSLVARIVSKHCIAVKGLKCLRGEVSLIAVYQFIVDGARIVIEMWFVLIS